MQAERHGGAKCQSTARELDIDFGRPYPNGRYVFVTFRFLD